MIDHLVRTDFKAVDKRDPVSTLYGFLRGEVDTVPIVLDGKRPYGVVNEKRLLRAHLDPHQHIERYVVGPGVLTPAAEEDEALRMCADEWVPHVPVWDGKKLLGYVRALDLLAETDRRLPAEALLVATPTLASSASVGDAMHTFYNCATHVLPVVDAQGRLLGVVDRHGLLPLATEPRQGGRKGAAGEVDDPRSSPVSGYVDGRFETVGPSTPYLEVVAILREFGFAIVLDRNRIRGIVTPESAAKAVLLAEGREALLPAPGRRSEGLPG